MKTLLIILPLFIFLTGATWPTSRPKLVVVIAIDQFRADYLSRFKDKFTQNGFKKLMGEGAYFPYGEFDILQSMTGPGHATLLTGAYPYQMGIPINDWYDQKTHKRMYCVDDAEVGISPKNLIGTTLGDEIKNAGIESKVVALAFKDRSAVLMGGHRADLAFWFNEKEKFWTTSKYYAKDDKPLPLIEKLNADSRIKTCKLDSPCGIELTFDAFKAALENYKLGQTNGTDVLAVSFSSHDFAGHQHGPNSKEMEEMTLAEDKAMSQIISLINQKVPGGMKNTVVVLTADHGIPPKPEFLEKTGIPSARLDDRAIEKNIEASLDKKFGKLKSGNWIKQVMDFNFFLDEDAIEVSGQSMSKVQAYIKEVLSKENGFAHVVTETDVKEKRLPPMMFERQILKTYFSGRSGHVIGLVKPFFMDGGKNKVTHMTGYTYDRTVPIIFYGNGIKKGLYADKAEVVDIAPTLSFLIGIVPPALSEGKVLKEALK